MSAETLPTKLSPYLAWRGLVDAIRAGTDLLPPTEDPFADNNQPAPLIHRQFQVQPGGGRYYGNSAPESALNKKGTVQIRLTHDYNPNQHEASWAEASSDFGRLEDAVFTRIESFRVLQPEPVSWDARLQGHTIVHTLVVTIDYSRRLPALSGV